VVAADGEHDGVGRRVAGRSGEVERAVVAQCDLLDADALMHRERELAGIGLHVVGDLVAPDEAIGVRPAQGVAGQAALPVGGNEAERVPALVAPAVCDVLALEDEVVHAALAQAEAHGQARLAAANDHDLVMAADVNGRRRRLLAVAPDLLHQHRAGRLAAGAPRDRLQVCCVPLDRLELGGRRRAPHAVDLADALARGAQARARAAHELGRRIARARDKPVLDRPRRRRTALLGSVGPEQFDVDFGHQATCSGLASR